MWVVWVVGECGGKGCRVRPPAAGDSHANASCRGHVCGPPCRALAGQAEALARC